MRGPGGSGSSRECPGEGRVSVGDDESGTRQGYRPGDVQSGCVSAGAVRVCTRRPTDPRDPVVAGVRTG